jgi:hypothetical protein
VGAFASPSYWDRFFFLFSNLWGCDFDLLLFLPGLLALYKFEGSAEHHELSMAKNERFRVVSTRDGWYHGMSLSSSNRNWGLIPMSYVVLDEPTQEAVHDLKARLAELVAFQPGNAICADCTEPLIGRLSWASVTYKCFLCTACSGVHRSLGVHISFVQSLTLDEWSAASVDEMSLGGNLANNALLEFHVPSEYPKPLGAQREEREKYIRAKYEARLFVYDGACEKLEPTIRAVTSAAASGRTNAASSVGEIEYKGILNVFLLAVMQILERDSGLLGDHTDAYAELSCGIQKVRSETIKDSLNPVWNEMLMVSWDGIASFEVTFMDKVRTLLSVPGVLL